MSAVLLAVAAVTLILGVLGLAFGLAGEASTSNVPTSTVAVVDGPVVRAELARPAVVTSKRHIERTEPAEIDPCSSTNSERDRRFPQGLDVLAARVEDSRAIVAHRKNVASAFLAVKYSLYLREDLAGTSHSLDKPLPASVDKRDFWISVNGLNGPRFYQFGADEYPLYWQLAAREEAGAESRAAELDEATLNDVLAFIDGALAMYRSSGK